VLILLLVCKSQPGCVCVGVFAMSIRHVMSEHHLQVFQQMQQLGCSADAILYNTLLDVLWDTGVLWAQHTAAQLLRKAMDEGHFRRLPHLQPAQQQQQGPSQQQQSTAQQQQAPRQKHKNSRPGSLGAAPAAAIEAGGLTKLELGLQGMSPGVALLMLHCWLADLRCNAGQGRAGHHCWQH